MNCKWCDSKNMTWLTSNNHYVFVENDLKMAYLCLDCGKIMRKENE
jgi:hypothetical protein